MTVSAATDVYYDPYDRAILEDPYPIFKRLREEAPLYYNESYDFFAVSRFDDVKQCLLDRSTFSSRKGVILEMIKADFVMPPGTLIHDDPPIHTAHRRLLSRVFTPRAMTALEPRVREFCIRRLDQLVGSKGFDVVAELSHHVPMQVFGMLLGISDGEQEVLRDHVEATMSADPGMPATYDDGFWTPDFYAPFVDHRYAHPGDDLITRLITTEFEDEIGATRTLTREEALSYLQVIAGAGNDTTNRLIGWTAKLLADHPDTTRTRQRPLARPQCNRGDPSLRAFVDTDRQVC